MPNATILRALVFGLTLLAAATTAHAQIVWDWSFNGGADSGQVITTGDPADLASAGSFAVLNLSLVTTSGSAAPGDVASGDYLLSSTIGASPFAIEWDGTQVSAFRDQNEFVGAPGVIEARAVDSDLMTQIYLGFNFSSFQGGLTLAEVATVNEIVSTATGAAPLSILPRPEVTQPTVNTPTRLVIETSHLSPGGGPFIASLMGRAPVISNDGRIAYVANVDNNPEGDEGDLRLLRSDRDGALRNIASEGQPLDASEQQFYVDFRQLQVNVEGDVGFQAEIFSPTQEFRQTSAIGQGNGLSAPTFLVRDTDFEPGADDHVFDSFETLSMNNLGRIAWRSVLDPDTSSGEGVYRSNSIGQPRRLARAGREPLDDGSNFDRGFGATAINEQTNVAFRADLNTTPGGSSDDSAVFRIFDDGNDPTIVAREGETVPGGDGRFDGFSDVGLDDANDLAFVADLRDTSGGATDNRGVYRGDENALVELFRKGDASPDGRGEVVDFVAPRDRGVAFNNAGQVAVRATLGGAGVDDHDNKGILLTDGTESVLAVREGDPAPGGGLFGDSLGDPFVNDAGQLVFTSELTGPGVTSANDFGLFAFDPTRGLLQVFREGGGVDFGGGDQRVIDDRGIAFGAGGFTTGTSGELAAMLQFTDGIQAIVATTIAQAPDLPFGLPGDFNGDGAVDLLDLDMTSPHGQYQLLC